MEDEFYERLEAVLASADPDKAAALADCFNRGLSEAPGVVALMMKKSPHIAQFRNVLSKYSTEG